MDKSPSNPSTLHPVPTHFNYPALLTAACNDAPLSIILPLWAYVRDLGFDPCWNTDCVRSLAKRLIDVSAEVYTTILSPFPTLTTSRSRLVAKRKEVDPLYVVKDACSLLLRIQQAVEYLGVYVGSELTFCTILCRLLAYIVKQQSPEFAECQRIARHLYRTVLLPSLAISPPNPTIHYELWAGLQHFSQAERFVLYTAWQSEQTTQCADVMYTMKYNYKIVDYYKRRMYCDNVEECMRAIMIVSFKSPVHYFRQLFDRCMRFPDQIKLIFPHMKCLSPLAVDVGCFTLLEFLQTCERHPANDMLSISSMYEGLTETIAEFVLHVNDRLDMTVMMDYLVKEIQKDVQAVLVLDKMIMKIAGVSEERS